MINIVDNTEILPTTVQFVRYLKVTSLRRIDSHSLFSVPLANKCACHLTFLDGIFY